jgi:NDP-sugar pyrophosphorylase family protein
VEERTSVVPLEEFFGHLDSFSHKELFAELRFPWEAVGRIKGYIEQYLKSLGKGHPHDLRRLQGVSLQEVLDEEGEIKERMLVTKVCLQENYDIYLEDLGIYIGKYTIIEPGVIIKSQAIIGEHSEIRQGAYLRGGVIVGNYCVVGHTTEVKNSVFLDGAEAGHFAYIGDSILGNHVNLGAGTKLANLQFRTAKEKNTGSINPIKIIIGEEKYETNLTKLGAILGDYVETGCNSVTSPGTLIGRNSWIYPNTTVRKGFYRQNSIIRPKDHMLEINLKESE